MSAQTAHIGAGLGVIAVVTGIAGTAMIALGAPRWAWAGFGLWGVVWLIAALSLSDGPTRGFLAGTLRKSNFTQIYATLMRRNVMGIWTRLCDPAPDSASAPALFRAALTWRLYDFALRLAVAYPILLLVGQWVVTGAEGRIGSFVVLSEAAVWPERAVTVAIVLILTGGVVGYRLTSASQRPMVRKAAGSLVRVAIAGSLFFVAVSGIFLFAVAVASTVGGLEPGVGLGVGVASISVALAAPGIVVVAVAPYAQAEPYSHSKEQA